MRPQLDGLVVGAPAKVLGRFGRLDDLARIHDVVGVEERLDSPESLIDLRAEEHLVVLAAGNAVAMLAAHRTAVLAHQRRHLVENLSHLGDFGSLFEIDHRAHVQTADRGMAVVAAVGMMVFENLLKTS